MRFWCPTNPSQRASTLAEVLEVAGRLVDSQTWSQTLTLESPPSPPPSNDEPADSGTGDAVPDVPSVWPLGVDVAPPNMEPPANSHGGTRRWIIGFGSLILVALAILIYVGSTPQGSYLGNRLTLGSKQNGTSGSAAPPSAPTDLQIVDGSGSVQISWAPSSGADSYSVWRVQSGTTDKLATVQGTSYVDGSVSSGTNYTYWITASNSIGLSVSSQAISVSTYVPWTQIHNEYADSVVEVTHCSDALCLSSSGGTGWFSPGGFVVTNYHVIESSYYYIDVTLQNDGSGSSYTGQTFHAHVVATDPADDLALLSLDNGWSGTPLPLAPAPSLSLGDPVAVLGHPGLEQLTMTTGTVQALNQTEQIQGYGTLSDMIVYDAGVVGGSSGSPLFDHWGKVVGVEEAAGTNNGNFDLAVPVSALITFLQQNGVTLGQ